MENQFCEVLFAALDEVEKTVTDYQLSLSSLEVLVEGKEVAKIKLDLGSMSYSIYWY